MEKKKIKNRNLLSCGTGGQCYVCCNFTFQPCRLSSTSTIKFFCANLRIPLLTIELSFDGKFALSKDDVDILIQISDGAGLWQKERLLNLALQALPKDIEHVTWLDCDIIFTRGDWPAHTKKQLKELNVVQLFSDVVFLELEDDVKKFVSLSDAKDRILVGSNLTKETVTYVTGFGWAAKRSLLDDRGFYDAAIIGGGDSLMAAAMFGQACIDHKVLLVHRGPSTPLSRMGSPIP